LDQDFIDRLQLEWVKSPDTGDFWGGVDDWEDQSFELFFTAGEDGPSAEQVDRYNSLRDHLGTVIGQVDSRLRSYLVSLEASSAEKWRNSPVELSIVSFYQVGADADVDLCCRVSRRVLFFTRSIDFVAGLRDNQIVSFEVM